MSKFPRTSWIQNWHPKPHARLRLFCFPYAGGGASAFHAFSAHLPPEIEVWPIQLPGRENRLFEPRFTQLAALISSLEESLVPYLDRPYAFFGHSMGALICFELARSLRRKGWQAELRHLCVSAYPAPQLPPARPFLHTLDDTELLEKVRLLNGTSEDVLQHVELRSMLLACLRGDFSLCETYIYPQEEPLSCPISIFGGTDDHGVGREALSAWSTQTTASSTLRLFAGGHFFLHTAQDPFLRALSEHLLRGLSLSSI